MKKFINKGNENKIEKQEHSDREEGNKVRMIMIHWRGTELATPRLGALR